jgi:hypothetical protein
VGNQKREEGRGEGKEREEGNGRPPVLVVSHGLDAFPHDKNQRIQQGYFV